MVNLKEMLNLKGLLSAISDDFGWWLTSFVLGLLQPVVMNKDPLTILGITSGLVTNLAPTIFGCLVAVYKSKLPVKERWAIIVSSLLFNGYILESICEYFFNAEPNSVGYFLGGFSAYFIFGFLFAFLSQLQTKGLGIVWKVFNNSAQKTADNLTSFADEMGDFMDYPDEQVKDKKPRKPRKNSSKDKDVKR